MDHFELVSEYAPTGDQPQAIEQTCERFPERQPMPDFTGLRVWQDFYNGKCYQGLNRPTLIIAHIKRWLHSFIANSKNSFRIMQLSILYPTMTTTNQKPMSHLRTPTLQRILPSMMRLISFDTLRQLHCRSEEM